MELGRYSTFAEIKDILVWGYDPISYKGSDRADPYLRQILEITQGSFKPQ